MVNQTSFVAERVVLQDKSGKDVLVVIVKCTYSIDGKGHLALAEKQVPIQMADDFYGEPGESSIRYESDVALKKVGTDVVLLGHAYSQGGKSPHVDVSLKVGALQSTVRVFGDRRWDKVLGITRISSSEPFEKIPLVYEHAYGGKDLSSPDPKHHEHEARNPVGRGFRAKKSKQNIEGILLPNLEDPALLIRDIDHRPEPVGFGFIGRHWQPRLKYAGTYDEVWMKNRCPLLPEDFNDCYFNGAHPKLVSRQYLQENDPVEVLNASANGSLRFSLPGDRPGAAVTIEEEQTPLQMVFDTLMIEPDENRVVMVWRGSMDIYNRIYQVKKIEVIAHA